MSAFVDILAEPVAPPPVRQRTYTKACESTPKPAVMSLDAAMAILRDAGYRVSKPQARTPKQTAPALNAVGKPYSPQFDPNYRMKYKPRRYACAAGESQNIGSGISPERWAEMCAEAAANWNMRNDFDAAWEDSQREAA